MDLTASRGTGAAASARLWFALFGGMAAYAVHLVVGFWAVPAACGAGHDQVVPWVVTGVTVAAVVVAVAAGLVAVRARRELGGQDGADAAPPPADTRLPRAWDVAPATSTAQFMATTGVLLNGLALAVVVVAGLPPLLVPPCA